MYYYYVWVRSLKYHSKEPLTYSYDQKLEVGSVVQVELRHDKILGIIMGVSTVPKFKTKEISSVFSIPQLPIHSVKLAKWMLSYYPSSIGLTTTCFLPINLSNISKLDLSENSKAQMPKLKSDNLPALNPEQALAITNMNDVNSYLLHGITGSGKTRIYMDLAVQSVSSGRSAIILLPEISLTSQVAKNFKQIFGDLVIIAHSGMTIKDRREIWLKALTSSQPLVVIGPRSTLFLPLKNIGLIVIDEFHEPSYKQEQAPGYLTSRVAAMLSNLTHAKLVIGSATPLVSEYYVFKQKNKPIINLNNLAKASDTTKEVKIIDHKDKSLFGKSPYLSDPLIDAIHDSMKNGFQSMLYLNRRGTARAILCSNCGWQAMCPHCNLALTYHQDLHKIICHSCNYRTNPILTCPECKSSDITFNIAGTKAIVDDVQKLFPSARIMRFDTDNKKSDTLENNFQDIHDGKVDILIGTQLLAKGLDLPKLATLGVLLADTSLYLPDFSSEERTFQLINQVIGRIGRGHVNGKGFVQTYNPTSKIINSAIQSDFASFYESEIDKREKFNFPPFCFLLKLQIKRATASSALSSANSLKEELQNEYKAVVEGPAPALYEKVDNKYVYQLIVKSKSRAKLLDIISGLNSSWTYNIDPVNLL